MSLPGTRFIESIVRLPGAKLPVRTVVFELGEARVLVSPSSVLTPDQLRQTGAITDVVAPSLTHTGGIKAAVAVHPGARLWGPPGVRDKLPELKWGGILGVDPWPYEQTLSLHPLAGMPQLNECVFLHSSSRTLFVTDLVFNIRDQKGLGEWLIFHAFGTYRRTAVSRLFLRYASDRRALEASLARIAGLDFENVVPAHGEPLLRDGKARLLAAFRERRLIA